jgi:redox-sensitive bicupin YhaK (pirin superfamily)
MIERRPFAQLASEKHGRLQAKRHFSCNGFDETARGGWGAISVWSDHEIASNAGFALHAHANVEIITYVREGAITHRDSLGNEVRIEAGSVQVMSAGTGIRHAEYNLDQAPAQMFQICITPASSGGSPTWAVQPCPMAERPGCFVVIASGFENDLDALPIRACARVLNAKLKVGETIVYALRKPRVAYLVPSTGTIDVNTVRIYARDGAAIKNVRIITITAIEAADVVMVDVLANKDDTDNIALRGKSCRKF